MKLEMTVSEVTEIYKEIQKQPDQLFEMIRTDIRETVGQYRAFTHLCRRSCKIPSLR